MYIQTWNKVTKLPKPMQRWTKRLCRLIIGHEVSRTEWGYAGGKRCDVWCRWCNQIGTADAAALENFKGARSLVYSMTGKVITGESKLNVKWED